MARGHISLFHYDIRRSLLRGRKPLVEVAVGTGLQNERCRQDVDPGIGFWLTGWVEVRSRSRDRRPTCLVGDGFERRLDAERASGDFRWRRTLDDSQPCAAAVVRRASMTLCVSRTPAFRVSISLRFRNRSPVELPNGPIHDRGGDEPPPNGARQMVLAQGGEP